MSGKSGIHNIGGMRNRRKGGLPAPAPASHAPASLAAHADSFLAHLAARAYSQGSIDAHRWALRQFTAWTDARAAHDPATFIRADMEAYQLFLHQYRSPRGGLALVVNTQLARLGCVRRFFAWLCRSGVIPANPAADLDLPRKQARHLPKLLSEQEIQLLLAIPNTADPFGLRDRAILELFYATGIRRTEMSNLDHGDYDPGTKTLVVRKGKNGKSRMLPIGERASAWLDQYLAQSRPLFHHLPKETALFLTGYGERFSPAYLGNWIKTLMKRCGINKTGSCHLWRHSCATDMHRGGADIRYVQEMLGHARMETTQIYTHVHIDALREVHARCHPHGTLGPDRDMHGKLTPPEIGDVDFPSPPPDDPLSPSTNMNFIQCMSDNPTYEVPECRDSPPNDPPRDDPPAGNVPNPTKPPPRPPRGKVFRNPLKIIHSRSGEQSKKTAGVTYYGYRYYDPVTGRWPSRDPIQERGGINLYGFVLNAPVSYFDVSGMYASSLNGLTPAELLALGVIGGGAATIPFVQNPPSIPDINIPDILPQPTPIPVTPPNTNPDPNPDPKPDPKPPGPTIGPPPTDDDCDKPNGCKPCTPEAGTVIYEIAPAGSRWNGAHVGIDHVKYWDMHQVPYSNTNPKACECFWKYKAPADDNTLIPRAGTVPGGPPDPSSGPTLGGGKLR